MLLNKKYLPKKNILTPQKIQGYYPVFLPNYEKISLNAWEHIYFDDLLMRKITQQDGKNYVPFLLGGLNSFGLSDVLAGKTKLPFFAKKQRLAQTAEKLRKKNIALLEEFLGKRQLFSFSPEYFTQMQSLCDLFSEHKMRKISEQLVYRDTKLQTPVHADAIMRKRQMEPSLQVKCFVEAKGEALILTVDDVMTFFSDVAVLVHRNDKRYKKYIGKNIILPIINKKIPILWADGIDTVKDHGVVRVNPLLSSSHLQQVKELGLSLDADVLDNDGYLLDQYIQKTIVINEKKGETHVGVKYNMLENIENIILGFKEIGNLDQESLQEQLVPYSSLSGSRLIKKIVPMLTLEIGQYKDEFTAWLEAHYPQIKEKIWSQIPDVIFMQVNNEFWRTFAMDVSWKCFFDTRMLLRGRFRHPLDFLLATLLINRQIASILSIDQLIDILYLLTEDELLTLAELFWEKEVFMSEISKIRDASAPEIIDFMQEFVKQNPGIEYSQDQLSLVLDQNYFLQENNLQMGVWDEQVLNAFFLSILAKDFDAPLVLPYSSSQSLILLLWISFLQKQEKKYIFIDQGDFSVSQGLWSEKIPNYAKTYWWDAIIFLMAQKIRPDEESLEEASAYLAHFWNLFKYLYENWAFNVTDDVVNPIDLWFWEQYELLQQEIEQKTWISDADILSKVQYFTKNYFSRYLEYIKNAQIKSYHAAGKIFLKVLDMLYPYLPHLSIEIHRLLWNAVPKENWADFFGKKDFRLHKLFAIVQKITEQKTLLNLKKHQPIQLCIKCGPQEQALIEENIQMLYSLLSVKQIEYTEGTKEIPLGFRKFSLLDMEVGVADMQGVQQVDQLTQLEQDLAAKMHYLQTVKQTLIMLSNLPVVDEARLEEREDEYELVKDQISILERKIQQIKMQKKWA